MRRQQAAAAAGRAGPIGLQGQQTDLSRAVEHDPGAGRRSRAPEQTWRLQHPSRLGALRGGCSDHRRRVAMRQRGASHEQMASWPRRPCGAVAGPRPLVARGEPRKHAIPILSAHCYCSGRLGSKGAYKIGSLALLLGECRLEP